AYLRIGVRRKRPNRCDLYISGRRWRQQVRECSRVIEGTVSEERNGVYASRVGCLFIACRRGGCVESLAEFLHYLHSFGGRLGPPRRQRGLGIAHPLP